MVFILFMTVSEIISDFFQPIPFQTRDYRAYLTFEIC